MAGRALCATIGRRSSTTAGVEAFPLSPWHITAVYKAAVQLGIDTN